MKHKLESMGIALTRSSPFTTQSNRLAKRMNCILLDKVHSMLEYAGLKTRYWGETIKHRADLHNRTIIKVLEMRTSMKALLRAVSNNSQSRVFGCAAYPQNLKERHADNFAWKVENVIFLGNMHRLHRIYIPTTRQVVLTKHVPFDEKKFHFSQNTSPPMNNRIEVNPSAKQSYTMTIYNQGTLLNKEMPPNVSLWLTKIVRRKKWRS